MIETVVIDTDILIDHLRGFQKAKIFLSLFEKKKIKGVISTITVMELLSGKSSEKLGKRRKIIELVNFFEQENVDFVIASKGGELRRQYGTNPMDSLIAATALLKNRRLVTCNINHYNKILELKLWKPYDK